jgi:glyoxylase I family protein
MAPTDATADAFLNATRAMLPFVVKRIDHVVFRVRDLQASVAFYSSVLGCEAVRTRDDLGLVHLRAGASMIDLISIDGKLGRIGGAGPSAGVGGRNVDHLCLRIEPFIEEALTLHLKQHGIVPHAKASTNFGAEGEGFSLYFDDPDGNVIELKGAAG